MISTLAPSAVQNARSFSTAAGSVPSGGVRMHQRLMNSSAKPESGPECSVPATGCAGTKCTPAGRCGAMSRDDRALDRADVGDDGARLEVRCDLLRHRRRRRRPECRGSRDRRPSTASALVSTTRSTMPSSVDARARLRRARGGDDFAGEALRARGARDRTADQAEADQRDPFE